MKSNEEYKALLKSYNLKDKYIGEMFGYKNASSWRTSRGKQQVMAGVAALLKHVKTSS